jgi:hypothetical protein
LVVLIAAALLGRLAGFVRHRIWLAGLIALLRLIRLVLLSHKYTFLVSAGALRARATVLIPHSTPHPIARLPADSTRVSRCPPLRVHKAKRLRGRAQKSFRKNLQNYLKPAICVSNLEFEGIEEKLVAETRADGNLMTALGAAAAQNCCACLRLHPGEEAVGLGAVAAVRLKGTLRHDKNSCGRRTLPLELFSYSSNL